MTAYIWHFVEPTAWKWSVLLEWKHNSQFFKYQKRWIIIWGIQKIGADMLDWGTGKSDAPCRNHLLYCFLEQRVWTSLLLKQIVCSFVKRVWSVVHGGPRLGLVSSASPPFPERANPDAAFRMTWSHWHPLCWLLSSCRPQQKRWYCPQWTDGVSWPSSWWTWACWVGRAGSTLTRGTYSSESDETGNLSSHKVHPKLLFVRLGLLPSSKTVLNPGFSGIKGWGNLLVSMSLFLFLQINTLPCLFEDFHRHDVWPSP